MLGRGFSEGLIEDLRVNAPHVRVAVVMPGHIGTDIVANSLRILGHSDPENMSDADLEALRPELGRRFATAGAATPEELRQILVRVNSEFQDSAPLSAADAATIILDGVRSGSWRNLVGEDAKTLDAAVRARPEKHTTTPSYSARCPQQPADEAGARNGLLRSRKPAIRRCQLRLDLPSPRAQRW